MTRHPNTNTGFQPMDTAPQDGTIIEAQCQRFSSSGTEFQIMRMQWNPIYKLWNTPEGNATATAHRWEPFGWRAL